MDDVNLVSESIKKAEKLMKILPAFDIVEKSMAINALAHGYYIGAKFAISAKRPFLKVFHQRKLDPNGLFQESHSAAVEYIRRKHPYIPETNKNLLKSALSLGFREGYKGHSKA